MSHSTTTNLLHLVWSTHSRKNSIPEELLQQLWDYFTGTGYNKRIPVIAAGGICNHVHLGIELPPTIKLSDAISAFKANSSRWLKEQGVKDFSWQNGYGAFSFGIPEVDQVRRYIHNQAERHRKCTFEEEFLELLKRAGVNYDPRHVFE
ncbi:MAG: IS200/IS605 family transposase [Terriglobales bacterium]|jgi:putative transposase